MSGQSVDGTDHATLELSRDEASRILLALTVRGNELERMGRVETADEFTELCQRIARKFEPATDQEAQTDE